MSKKILDERGKFENERICSICEGCGLCDKYPAFASAINQIILVYAAGPDSLRNKIEKYLEKII